MDEVQSAEFRKSFAEFLEPVRVLKYKAVLGTWYPAGSEEMPPEDKVNQIVDFALEDQGKEIEALQAEVKQLKRQLAASAKPGPTISLAGNQGFGRSRPAPKPGKKS